MTPSWKLLGPLEAADGALMFGISTAMIFAVIFRLVQARYVDLREIARTLRRTAGDSDWFFAAGVYAAVGDNDEAFACLEKAYERHDFFLVFLKVHPYMDPLRSDPRYAELVHRIGLP